MTGDDLLDEFDDEDEPTFSALIEPARRRRRLADVAAHRLAPVARSALPRRSS